MSRKNQILLIERFIKSNDENILINQVTEGCGLFYLNVIKYFAEKYNIRVCVDDNGENILTENDLFGEKAIKVFSITNIKKLTAILSLKEKKIIFTDYKNFKKLNNEYNSINGYELEFDIIFFVRDVLKINNDDLLSYCKNNPVLLFSETSKYLVNYDQYSSDRALEEKENHILNIRKSIFEIKKNGLNIKNLYLNIRKEAEYKKLSFLTY